MQPSFEIRFHPVDLSRHGLNPYGQPIYRVIWADTRKSKVMCRGKRYILPRYRHGEEANASGHFVLERWAPPEVIVGMTREQYEAFLSGFPNAALEEYPERGDFELSRIFNETSGPFAAHIDEVALHKQLEFHEWRFKATTTQDRKLELEAAEEASEAVQDEKFDTLYEEGREQTLCQDS
jgi:hypothetical protein